MAKAVAAMHEFGKSAYEWKSTGGRLLPAVFIDMVALCGDLQNFDVNSMQCISHYFLLVPTFSECRVPRWFSPV